MPRSCTCIRPTAKHAGYMKMGFIDNKKPSIIFGKKCKTTPTKPFGLFLVQK
jgi:hypothetical protein